MKYLVIGLGNFGSTLAATLTDMGYSVIGVDCKEHCIEEIKDRIDLAYIMDATERASLRSLPLDEIDCVIVAMLIVINSNNRVPHIGEGSGKSTSKIS